MFRFEWNWWLSDIWGCHFNFSFVISSSSFLHWLTLFFSHVFFSKNYASPEWKTDCKNDWDYKNDCKHRRRFRWVSHLNCFKLSSHVSNIVVVNFVGDSVIAQCIQFSLNWRSRRLTTKYGSDFYIAILVKVVFWIVFRLRSQICIEMLLRDGKHAVNYLKVNTSRARRCRQRAIICPSVSKVHKFRHITIGNIYILCQDYVFSFVIGYICAWWTKVKSFKEIVYLLLFFFG